MNLAGRVGDVLAALILFASSFSVAVAHIASTWRYCNISSSHAVAFQEVIESLYCAIIVSSLLIHRINELLQRLQGLLRCDEYIIVK